MHFGAQREVLLRPLQQVIGVVEKRQTLPVLANVLLQLQGSRLTLTTSDLEVELASSAEVDVQQEGELTIPARKLFDLVRALPDGAGVDIAQQAERVVMRAGRSRYTLATLPAAEFPQSETGDVVDRFVVPQSALKQLIEATGFAMAVQDVRFYLNGLLLERRGEGLRAVATDGHRLALADWDAGSDAGRQVILPRKGVLELQRLLDADEGDVELVFTRNHLRVAIGDSVLVSKLIDGRFPDYEAVIPVAADVPVAVEREELKAALLRAAILSNEKYRGIRVELAEDLLRISAHNPEQEEAVEEIGAQCAAQSWSIGFNVNYVLDALNALGTDQVVLRLRDGNSSVLLESPETRARRHVVMPLRL
ncbi:MAG: DNA polymerase III subunit beta [Xanthomonadales bacterium]|nr:DNA polymerase III subunit beta [Xanthomonadales bacterium]MCB1641663.1 DNA polymerase III subunit beta [Xanthomonadales bacterium]